MIPPDYTLAPPVSGTVGLSATDAQSQAIEALFGGPAPRSDSETSLLQRAGRDRVALGARSTAGDPATLIVDKGAATQAIIAAAEGDSQDATAQTPPICAAFSKTIGAKPPFCSTLAAAIPDIPPPMTATCGPA